MATTAVKVEVPQVIIRLEANKTSIEVNDAALRVPTMRMQRALQGVHKEVHLRRLEQNRKQAKAQLTK